MYFKLEHEFYDRLIYFDDCPSANCIKLRNFSRYVRSYAKNFRGHVT